VNSDVGKSVRDYIAATPGATAKFTDGAPTPPASAPSIAGFSSRGPSLATGDQLKPDISAPGVDVLAAVAPTNHGGKLWDLESGTSMSSPHIAGLSLLIKQAHPDWTPDMIKSAMMTTAYDLKDPVVDPFAQGAGHVDPTKFLDPGLVYQSGGFPAYLAFICATMGNSVSSACPTVPVRPNELNLPSLAIGALAGTDTLHRTVTSVGSTSETYTASVQGLTGVSVAVSPSTFTIAPGAAQQYTVDFAEVNAPFAQYAKGSITLTGDKGHVVRVPVVVQPVKLAAPTQVDGAGAAASAAYNVKSGFAGTLTTAAIGLQAADKRDDTVNGDPSCGFDTANPDAAVANGTATVDDFTTPANTGYARFQTFQADVSSTVHDLDMFVYRADPMTGKFALLASSGGPDANEFVGSTSSLLTASGTKLKVYILGCGVDGNGSFPLYAWFVPKTSPSNAFTATPAATQAVTVGQTIPLTFSWSGLAAGNRYLGRVTYSDGSPAGIPGTTLIQVSTR
jgi:fibronectin type III domain protein/subtilase family protein